MSKSLWRISQRQACSLVSSTKNHSAAVGMLVRSWEWTRDQTCCFASDGPNGLFNVLCPPRTTTERGVIFDLIVISKCCLGAKYSNGSIMNTTRSESSYQFTTWVFFVCEKYQNYMCRITRMCLSHVVSDRTHVTKENVVPCCTYGWLHSPALLTTCNLSHLAVLLSVQTAYSLCSNVSQLTLWTLRNVLENIWRETKWAARFLSRFQLWLSIGAEFLFLELRWMEDVEHGWMLFTLNAESALAGCDVVFPQAPKMLKIVGLYVLLRLQWWKF